MAAFLVSSLCAAQVCGPLRFLNASFRCCELPRSSVTGMIPVPQDAESAIMPQFVPDQVSDCLQSGSHAELARSTSSKGDFGSWHAALLQ